VSQLRERGWKALDRGDTSAAVDTFEKATVASPADAESWYGLGYARNAAGQAEAARTALCKASTLAKGPMKAEIERILLRDQMACP
jgi:Flp pilus assembly protein TadD